MTTRTPTSEVLKSLLISRYMYGDCPGIESVIAASKHRPANFTTVIRKLFYRTMDRQFKRPQNKILPGVAAYFSQLRGNIQTDEFRYFDAALTLTATALEAGLTKAAQGDQEKIVTIEEAVKAQYLRTFGKLIDSPEAVAFHTLIGQIYSLHNREAAGSHFAEVQISKYRDLIPLFYWDSGATTYYTRHTVETDRARQHAQLGVNASYPLRQPAPGNKTVIVISVDESFFRIYVSWFIFYAQQLPELDFAIYICAPGDRAKTLVEDCNKFARSLSQLTDAPVPLNISYSTVSTPSFVADERTYFACARFFALPHLLKTYDNAYLVDADLYFENDPTSFLSKVRNYNFGAVVNGGLIALPPWRRYMAGNVVANKAILDTAVLDHLLTYMAHGLSESSSWMLDQNAISYAVECAQPVDGVCSINDADRPTIASKFMTRWEKNFALRNRPVEIPVSTQTASTEGPDQSG